MILGQGMARKRAALALLSLLVACSQPGDAPPEDVVPTPEATGLPDSLSVRDRLAVGEEAYWEGEFEVAQGIWRDALERAETTGEKISAARILTWLGLAAYRLGEYEDARTLGEEALERKLLLDLRQDLFKSYNALGLLAWSEGRLNDATGRLVEASVAAQAVGDDEGVAKAENNLGLVYTERGEFDRARESFQRTVTAGREFGDARIEGTGYNNLGMLDVRVGDPIAGVVSLREARRLYRSIDYVNGEQNTLGQLGTAYSALGQPSLAIAMLDSALAMARDQGLSQEEASNLGLIGEVYEQAGDPRRALRFYSLSKELNQELGLEVEWGTSSRSEAEVYALLGDLTRARDLTEEALDIHRAVGAQLEAIWDYLLLAEILARLGESGLAAEHLRSAHELEEEVPARIVSVEVALTEARIADAAREFQAVLQTLETVSEDLQRSTYRDRGEAEQLRARAYAGLGLADSAATAGRKAVALVERVREGLGSTILRTAFVADRGLAYSELVDVLLRLGEVEEAFAVSDAARGRALLEHLVAGRDAGDPKSGSIHMLGESEALLRQIEAIIQQLDELETATNGAEPESQEAIAHLSRRLLEARDQYETLMVNVAEQDRAAQAILIGRSEDAEDIQETLREDEVLLEYLVTPDRLLMFVMTRQEIHSLESTISARDLASRVRLARELVADPDFTTAEFPPVLESLYEILMGPVVRSGTLAEAKRLILVPHGVLHYLPFSALREGVTGRYLIEDYPLLFLPSAAVLPVTRSVTAAEAPKWGEISGAVFAPFPDRFPATDWEAGAVRSALSGVRVYRGSGATQPALMEALGEDRIIHVATHAVMNAVNPMFSRIETATGSSSSAGDDGRLEIHEVVSARMQSPLVFLSGCETGAGTAWTNTFLRGEDYATLAKAFLYAGAGSVIATMWRIEDEGAAEFARRFYENLPTSTPVEALAEAQRMMLKHSRYSAPFYWAAYRISGSM